MKRLIFSDLHLHPWTYGSTVFENGFNSRLWHQRAALDYMMTICMREDIKYVYFGGDLFHTPGNVPTQALQIAGRFFRALNALGVKYRLLVGNHDMCNRQGTIHALDWLNHEPNLIVRPNEHGSWQDDGLNVNAIGYTKNADTLKRFFDDASKTGGMILMHQGVAGVPLSSGYVIDEVLTPAMIPDNCRAFTGHYHFHKAVTPNLTVIGNLTAQNWNDLDQDKGFIIWDDETNEFEWRSSEAPQFITHSLISSLRDPVRNNFVRINDQITHEHALEVRTELIKAGALTVEFTNIEEDSKEPKDSKDVFNLNEYIAWVEREMEPRRKKVGSDIREESYEAP